MLMEYVILLVIIALYAFFSKYLYKQARKKYQKDPAFGKFLPLLIFIWLFCTLYLYPVLAYGLLKIEKINLFFFISLIVAFFVSMVSIETD